MSKKTIKIAYYGNVDFVRAKKPEMQGCVVFDFGDRVETRLLDGSPCNMFLERLAPTTWEGHPLDLGDREILDVEKKMSNYFTHLKEWGEQVMREMDNG